MINTHRKHSHTKHKRNEKYVKLLPLSMSIAINHRHVWTIFVDCHRFLLFFPPIGVHTRNTHTQQRHKQTHTRSNKCGANFRWPNFPEKKEMFAVIASTMPMGHAGWSKRYSVAALGTSMNDFPLFCLLECHKLILFGMQNAEMMQCLHFWLVSEWIRVVALRCVDRQLLWMRLARRTASNQLNWTETLSRRI